MTSFKGFPPGKIRFTPIPAPFFTELLPAIDDLGELKVTLYALWQLDRMEGSFRYLCSADFSEDTEFMQGLGADRDSAQTVLDNALERAVARGTLLAVTLDLDERAQSFYFLNTARGQAAVKAIVDGKWQPSGDARYPIALGLEPPNIFRLFEENIGPITPLIADTLRDAEETYPLAWIEEAIQAAVEQNARSWKYIEAILERRQKEGRHGRQVQGDTQEDRRRYIEGKYSDFIEH
ncbi:MAG: DnaD domain protein [Anaerolineales bacterium]|nr:DnaD domain protein [Anaerolineales bacterium]